MTVVRCDAGHASEDIDTCTVCGAPIPTQVRKAPTPSGEVSATDVVVPLPPRSVPPPPQSVPPPPRSVPPPPLSVPAPRTTHAWTLVLSIDPSLDVVPDPTTPCPVGIADTILPVDRPEMLVGRHDERLEIHPELSLRDPGASRRHAKFVLLADGGLALQDLAPMNGTKLNGEDVAPGSRRRLHAGDEVTLGRWTRIRVRAV